MSRSIVTRFGGGTALGRILGIPQRTVNNWEAVGRIPAKWQAAVLAAGQALDPPLTPADFFPAREETDDAAPQKERSRPAAAD